MPIRVKFPDGSAKEFPDGSTALDVARSISKGLAKASIAAKVNGQVRDLSRPLPAECDLVLLKEGTPEALEVQRHSGSHVLAGAVRRLYGPDAKFGVGPPVDDGFFYDIEFPGKVSEDDLPGIEAEMRKIVQENVPFVREDLPKEVVVRRMRDMGQGYKLEILKDIPDATASIYTDGDFVDMCEGPHVPSTGRVGAFKLDRITGAYWRGNAANKMLTRIYGLMFHDDKELQAYVTRREEAKKRDHRKLGQELELFMFHDWSPGAPFFLPKGTVIYNELLSFIRAEYRKRGFQEVVTPQLFNKGLWELSGHWEHYRENMFLLKIDEEDFSLKPMNCPSHVLMFKHRRRSYRELPMRIADFCPLHRNELRGVLAGLTRVRKFQQDDAHIFCTVEQIEQEIRGQIDFVNHVYGRVFRMPFAARLATRPPQFLGEAETWDRAEAALEKALKDYGVTYSIDAGGGVFYGPKIDFDMRDALGRPWQLSTIQLDFQLPQRMDAKYEGPDGKYHHPVMIHRAILGSLERFIGVLTEHYGGEFPLWLSPVQAVVLPVTDKDEGYAKEVGAKLAAAGVRCEIDLSNDRISYKIRASQLQKVPYMLVVGAREREAGTVAVRDRKKGDLGPVRADDFLVNLRREIGLSENPAAEA
ncbi:MAG: threonine--tRNA ligase [Planctomycetes bacterium]|nr:threonine--tRNA ligase [Planctomycetota bacterium]